MRAKKEKECFCNARLGLACKLAPLTGQPVGLRNRVVVERSLCYVPTGVDFAKWRREA